MTVATEAKTRMVSSLKTEAKRMIAVMKMITSLLLLVMQMGTTHAMTMVLTRAITVVLAATVLDEVFVLHPLSCQQ